MDSKKQNSKDQMLNLVELLIPVNSATTIGSTFSSNNSEKYSSNDDMNDLDEFCEEIEELIKRAEERLIKAYESKTQRKLEKKLQLYVKKLKSLQAEMKTITDNIGSIKNQCASVKGNLREIKKETKNSKAKEINLNISRIPIEIEKRKFENPETQNNLMNPEYSFRQVIPVQQPSTSKRIRSSNEMSLSRFFDSATSQDPTTTRSRVTFNGSTVKKLKKLKKDNSSWPQTAWEPTNNGVTLHLFPVNSEITSPVSPKVETVNKIEKIKFPTPTTSIANISWRSTQTDLAIAPEPPPTDTTASSLTSKLNLLIIDSDELDELD